MSFVSERKAKLQFPPPVYIFWLEIDAGFMACAVACCMRCKKSERSLFGIPGRDALGWADEIDALWQLKLKKHCPHTEPAFGVMSLLVFEDPTQYRKTAWEKFAGDEHTKPSNP